MENIYKYNNSSKVFTFLFDLSGTLNIYIYIYIYIVRHLLSDIFSINKIKVIFLNKINEALLWLH